MYVVVEGFERRDVQDADARIKRFAEVLLNKMIDRPEERRQGFAGTRRSKYEGMLAGSDTGPAEFLWWTRPAVGMSEPVTNYRVEVVEDCCSRHGSSLLELASVSD
jgi:hypothetical protein